MLNQWILIPPKFQTWIFFHVDSEKSGTVDGNQKSGINSPVEGQVVYPIIYKVFSTIPRWLALGFLKHQQYVLKLVKNPLRSQVWSNFLQEYPPKLTVRPWKWMVRRRLSYWGGLLSGANCWFQGGYLFHLHGTEEHHKTPHLKTAMSHGWSIPELWMDLFHLTPLKFSKTYPPRKIIFFWGGFKNDSLSSSEWEYYLQRSGGKLTRSSFLGGLSILILPSRRMAMVLVRRSDERQSGDGGKRWSMLTPYQPLVKSRGGIHTSKAL